MAAKKWEEKAEREFKSMPKEYRDDWEDFYNAVKNR
jgi:hypothetical protein